MLELRIGDLLLEEGLVSKYQVEYALSQQKELGKKLGRVMIELDFVTRKELSSAVANASGYEYIGPEDLRKIPQEVIDKVPFEKCDEYRALPFKEVDGSLYIALEDPTNITITDDLGFITNMHVVPHLADLDDLAEAIEKYHHKSFGSLDNLIDETGTLDIDVVDEVDNSDDITQVADSKPVIRLLNAILKTGIEHEASDIHFEPYEDGFRVRYRMDGVLYEMEAPPAGFAQALIARIKIVSKLNISETRLPQDGRISLTIAGRPVDLRVSTVPTKFGESAVLRILDKGVVSLDLHNLRMNDEEMGSFQRNIKKPNGIMLVTGPTGSGKTTTLYACLNEINKEDIKIITNEDPVEYNIDGLIQVPINAAQGLSFGSSLRASLRQDPDVILIGEIRDKETAEIAVESALTGHFVFSTLHTNDAPSTVTRLTDMGIESYMVAATLECVVAQRLVRTICPNCKVPYNPTEESIMQLGIDPSDVDSNVQFFRGEGCDACRGTRYKGRLALYEVLELNSTLREMIIGEAPTQELYEASLEAGMRPLRQVGIQKVFDGLTTIDEVVQATVTGD
jgi:type IV pilus assembly protein PilB